MTVLINFLEMGEIFASLNTVNKMHCVFCVFKELKRGLVVKECIGRSLGTNFTGNLTFTSLVFIAVLQFKFATSSLQPAAQLVKRVLKKRSSFCVCVDFKTSV